MEPSQLPRLELAEKVLPKPLLESIQNVFKQKITGCALVGGTALAGFYASHRRSDDMDLFVKSEVDFRAAVLAVKNLSKYGAELTGESLSAQYYHANCLHRKHRFTIDIVLDENLFKVGGFHELEGGLKTVDLPTLLKMKAATLVSRCGEKDLFDLKWLLGVFPEVGIGELIRLGNDIDRGVSAENMLASIGGTKLRQEACDFAHDPKMTAGKVFSELEKFQKVLISSLIKYAKEQPAPPLAELVRGLKK